MSGIPPWVTVSEKRSLPEMIGNIALIGEFLPDASTVWNWLMPMYDSPKRPTSPLASGRWAAQWARVAPSVDWTGSNKSKLPPESPVPRTSAITTM